MTEHRDNAETGEAGSCGDEANREPNASEQDAPGLSWRPRFPWGEAALAAVHIPKEKGKTRPIGISAFEDKLVQDAVREVLEAVYE